MRILTITSTVVLCLFLSISSSYAQGEGNLWYFGGKLGLDFSTSKPTVIKDGAINTYEGCATIADASGNLLFYTDGVYVWNAQHQVMPNGNGLGGHASATQSGVIVPKPKSQNLYYIFTIDASENALVGGLKYSIVDMKQHEGKGDIVEKNIDLIHPTCEKITAVMHQDSLSYWIVAHGWDNNAFHSFLLTDTGVVSKPITSHIGTPIKGEYKNGNGYLKASSSGNRIASAYYLDNIVEVYDFDNATGKVSHPIVLRKILGSPYGVEFSPSDQMLYVSSLFNQEIFQYDLSVYTQKAIEKSRYRVRNTGKGTLAGSLQLAKDGKIYISDLDSKFMPAIANPNGKKSACDYQAKYIDLGDAKGRLGLPTFIQSFFVEAPIERQIVEEVADVDLDINDLSEGLTAIAVKEDIIQEKSVEIEPVVAQPKYFLTIKTFEKVDNTNKKILENVNVQLNETMLKETTIPIEGGKNYTFQISKDGYQSTTKSWSIDVSKLPKEDYTFELEAVLNKVVEVIKKEKITLQDIYFDFDKADLKDASQLTLNNLTKILKDNPTAKVQLTAHADCRGTNNYNLALSQRRATSVIEYLKTTGITPDRISSRDLGEEQPAILCETCDCSEPNHAQNRRVTVRIIE